MPFAVPFVVAAGIVGTGVAVVAAKKRAEESKRRQMQAIEEQQRLLKEQELILKEQQEKSKKALEEQLSRMALKADAYHASAMVYEKRRRAADEFFETINTFGELKEIV